MKKKFSILVLFILFCSLFCSCSDDSENSSDRHETSMYSVYFCSNNIANWNKVYVYAWDDKGENAEWPGLMMKKTGNGLYFSDVKFSNIIFNDGDENQTVDLEAQDGYFLPTSKNNKITGIWYKKNPNLAGGNGADDSSGNKDSETFVLSAPTGLKASYISSNSEIKVTWNSVSGADCYEFYWGTSNNPNKAKKGNDKTGTEAYLINVEEGD